MSWLKKILGSKNLGEPARSQIAVEVQLRDSIFDLPNYSSEKPYRVFFPRSSQDISRWAKAFPGYCEIVGYSLLGHFFLRNPDSQEYIVLHPFKGAAKAYGVHGSVQNFENDVLNEPGFSLYTLRPDHVSDICRLIGELEEDEIYIPDPYPMFGGTEAPETYSKGNVWVFMDVVAEMAGLDT